MSEAPWIFIVRLADCDYKDQYGVKHRGKRVVEKVKVQRTEEFEAYDYYGHEVKDYWYVDESGRRYRGRTPTDYGGETTWSRNDGDTHLFFWRLRPTWAGLAIIDEEAENGLQEQIN